MATVGRSSRSSISRGASSASRIPSPRLVTRASGRPSRRARAIRSSGSDSGARALGVATRRRNWQAAIAEIGHHLLQIPEAAEHGHAAHHLSGLVGAGRQDPLGREPLDRARLDRPQHHLDVGAPPEQQRRRGGGSGVALPGSGVFEVAKGEAGTAEQEDLQDPVEQDGDLAEEVEPVEIRRDQHVVEDEQRQRHHAGGADDAARSGSEAKRHLVR